MRRQRDATIAARLGKAVGEVLTPLGTRPADSRFCSRSAGYSVLYTSHSGGNDLPGFCSPNRFPPMLPVIRAAAVWMESRARCAYRAVV